MTGSGLPDSDSRKGVTRTLTHGVAVETGGASALEAAQVRCRAGEA
jgi:hypothetical protein